MMRLLVFLVALSGSVAAQSTLVLPRGFEGVEAGAATSDPFDRGFRAARAQYGYDASQLSASAPIEIYRLRVRADGGAFSFGGRFARCRVRIGACDDHAALGRSFDGNWSGPQPAPSYDGPVRVAPADRSSPGRYYIDIGLLAPARFDPASGRDLLIEFAVDGGGLVGSSAPSDAVSGASGVTQVAKSGSGSLPDGDVSPGTGLVVELFYRPLRVVVPANAQPFGGNTTTRIPFGSTPGPFRVQYCYDSSRFTDAGVNYPIVISELQIPSERVGRLKGGVLRDCEVRIGSAAIDHGALSDTFDWNWLDGIVPPTAYSGSVTVPDVIVGRRFSVVKIPLTSPVVYDPGSGSDLLIEFSSRGSWSRVPSFDMAAQDVGSRASRLSSRGGPTARTGSITTGLGLVVRIGMEPAADQPNDGFLLGQGLSYLVRSGTRDTAGNPLSPQAFRTKKAGFSPGQERGLADPALPDHRWTAIFGNARGLEVDAVSIGLDRLWADDNGQIRADCRRGAWNVLAFTVAPATGGATGRVHAEQALGDGVAGDVFGYALGPSAEEVPARFRGRTLKLLNGSDLDIAETAGDPGVVALDGFIPAFGLRDVITDQLREQRTVWFSVTDVSKANIPSSWLGGDPRARSGATVFRTTWFQALGGWRWSTPRVDSSPDQLGLHPLDDIDALAVDTDPLRIPNCGIASDRHYLFSLTADSLTVPESELLFVARPAGGWFGPTPTGPLVYTDTDGKSVADKIGGGDRVRSVCLEDPGPLQIGPGGPDSLEEIFRAVWGMPREIQEWVPSPFGVPLLDIIPPSRWRSSPALNLDVLSSCTAAGEPTLVSLLAGWPGGRAEPSTAFLAFVLPGLGPAGIQLVDGMLIPRPGGADGDPSRSTLVLPVSASLVGLELGVTGMVLTRNGDVTFSNVSSLWLYLPR